MAPLITAGSLVLLLLSVVSAQKVGTAIPEHHPPLTTYKCTVAGGCHAVNTSVVLDAFSRSFHSVSSPSTPCSLGTAPLCDTPEACAENCALEGIDYSQWGIRTAADALTLNQWRIDPLTNKATTVSPRTYLVASDGENYENVTLLNAEFSFDVDMSNLPCGMNGALYLSEMELDGGRSVSTGLNSAGATYGTGYCDAQCPALPFINGVGNQAKHGACCNEMDIWEANAATTIFTPHPCNATRIRSCDSELTCGQPTGGYCDKWGCSYNAYAHGFKDFYGRNKTIDTNRKFTVVTQFLTSNGKADGKLTDIKRVYMQDGKVIKNVVAKAGGKEVDGITDGYCNATASWTQERGGIEVMGEALGRGMVLIFSLWADDSTFMNWMDSGSAGPCNDTEGDPRLIVQHTPGASVTFSNVRWGEIGSTYKA